MSSIVVEPTATAHWHSLVHEAEAACHHQLPEDTESYLVFLLMRYLQKPDMVSRIVALEYMQSLHATGQIKAERLRDVGDHCLLFSGLFPALAERRRVRVSYYVNLGRSAYAEVAQTHCHDLYQHLAQDFVVLMDILQAIRNLGQHHNTIAPLTALDLWEDTGSKVARQGIGPANTTLVLGNQAKH